LKTNYNSCVKAIRKIEQ